MIKGSLKDVSLPGLLQFLSNEGNKSYRIKVERGSLHGDVYISNGHLISATYGLLRGEDAVCEFLTWDDGVFFVERLPSRIEATVDKNITLKMQQTATFSDQASFLLEDSVGLNTLIRPSRMFGTPEWQESSKLQPLQREDFLILGWLSDGRSMRQAMREFAFDLIQATAILYRLLLTRSVEVVRATVSKDIVKEIQAELRETEKTVEPEPAAAAAVEEGEPSQETTAPVAVAPPPAPPAAEPSPETASKRTTVLPIISIDIERLMKAVFTISEFGFLALKNPMLDENIRFILLKVEEEMTVESVVQSTSKTPAAILSTYRYCLERGYINNPDSVLPLTADLLLGRTELDQYLLQRRRVTGEQVRDLTGEAREQGVKLSQMLVKGGFLSQEDLDTVVAQQLRFAMH